jgi:hypothetical protein
MKHALAIQLHTLKNYFLIKRNFILILRNVSELPKNKDSHIKTIFLYNKTTLINNI